MDDEDTDLLSDDELPASLVHIERDDYKSSNFRERDFEDDVSEKSKSDISSLLPPLPLHLATQLLQGPGISLEPLAATKAAVAQFAENNLPPHDLAVLHSTLYNLQQQQLVQLQLIQQLQQHLLTGVPPLPPLQGPTLTPPAPGAGVVPQTSGGPSLPEGSSTGIMTNCHSSTGKLTSSSSSSMKANPPFDILKKEAQSDIGPYAQGRLQVSSIKKHTQTDKRGEMEMRFSAKNLFTS